jgi:hypothetical protein
VIVVLFVSRSGSEGQGECEEGGEKLFHAGCISVLLWVGLPRGNGLTPLSFGNSM